MVALQIGGVRAPSPVGELGNVEMTQAINLVDSSWQVVGPDVLLTGRLSQMHTRLSYSPISRACLSALQAQAILFVLLCMLLYAHA